MESEDELPSHPSRSHIPRALALIAASILAIAITGIATMAGPRPLVETTDDGGIDWRMILLPATTPH